MSADYDKEQWQAEQAARDSALDKQREKEAKTCLLYTSPSPRDRG